MLAIRPLTVAALALVLAGCGSSGSHGYTLDRTQKCLNGSGVHASRFENRTVTGSGGELQVTFGYGAAWIYIAFGKDPSEARTIQDSAIKATLLHDKLLDRKTVLAGVRQTGNVFYYSDGGPVTVVESTQIEACLR